MTSLQLAEAAGVPPPSEEALEEAAMVATVHGRERRLTMLKQLAQTKGKLTLARSDEAKWKAQLSSAQGASCYVPVFPIGDSLLEPFWPQGKAQGLGSGRRAQGLGSGVTRKRERRRLREYKAWG